MTELATFKCFITSGVSFSSGVAPKSAMFPPVPIERRNSPSGNPRIADLKAPIDVKKALPVRWNSALHATRAAQDDLIWLNYRSIQIEAEFTRGQNDPQIPNSL